MQRTKPRSANGLPAVVDDQAMSQAVEASPREPNTETITREITRINPRTGKPLVMPKPLSLSPHPLSPIVPEIGEGPIDGQMIQEEHEEVSLLFITAGV